MLYEIHTKDKMFTQNATHFIADKSGVVFFDAENRGIAFVPNFNLLFVRENENEKEADRQKREMIKTTYFMSSKDAS